eukprot:190016-Chlamydomonas_euryale.AAC.1
MQHAACSNQRSLCMHARMHARVHACIIAHGNVNAKPCNEQRTVTLPRSLMSPRCKSRASGSTGRAAGEAVGTSAAALS